MITRSFDEMIQSFLSFLVRRNDLIDIKPTAITRTLIDSVANELAVVNNEIENVRNIQTILNAASMSINEMDNLAANFGVSRKEASFAAVEITFYITRQPRQDITIPQGTVIGTIPDEGNSISQFATLEDSTMYADRINSYFSANSGFYEITARAKALTPGSSGNVPPNSLVRSIGSINSGYDTLLATNKIAATGGTDEESNTDLASRVFVSISGINVGTKDGYKSSALSVQGVVDAIVIGAGDPMMVRDYNSLGQHIGGRVDVYVQGQSIAESQDRIGSSLQQKLAQQIKLIDGSILEFYVPDLELEKYPLISIDRVYTIIDNPIFNLQNQTSNSTTSDIAVTIVSPINQSIVDGGIDVSVRAYKITGNIVLVNLIINGTSVNKMSYDSNIGFYKFHLNTINLGEGLVQLEAEAYDELQQKTVSTPVMINVRNLHEISVSILSPEAGATIPGSAKVSTYAFSKAGIANRGVEIRVNDSRWIAMEPTTVPSRWSYPLIATHYVSGSVKIEVRATDKEKRTAYTLPRYVVVENGPSHTLRNNKVMAISLRNLYDQSSRCRSSDSDGSSPIESGRYTITTPGVRTQKYIKMLTAGGNDTNLADCRLDIDGHSFPILDSDFLNSNPFEYRPILDKDKIDPILSHKYTKRGGEIVGTENEGIVYKSNVDACNWEQNYHTGNTIGWPGDKICCIEEDQENNIYIGSDNGGLLVTPDCKSFIKEPIPLRKDTSVTCCGFINMPSSPDWNNPCYDDPVMTPPVQTPMPEWCATPVPPWSPTNDPGQTGPCPPEWTTPPDDPCSTITPEPPCSTCDHPISKENAINPPSTKY